MAIAVNTIQARECIIDCIRAQLVPMLRGSPGMGKSALVKGIAKEFNLELIELRLSQREPVDLVGYPMINQQTKRSYYAPLESFPLEGDPLPEGKDGWLLFLDEAPNADKAMQKAAYQVMERQVDNRKLHPQVAIVSAGNLETDNAFVEEMSTALQSRIIQYQLQIDHEAWLEWAEVNNIHHYVTSFIKWKPVSLYQFDPNGPEETFPCPRTWEFASRFLHQRDKNLNDPLLRANLAGALGEGMAREFLGYCKVYMQLPGLEEILRAPTTIPVPDERSIIWAITGSIATWAKESILDKLMLFVDRFPKEFQVVTLREMVRRQPALGASTVITNWISKNSVELW